MTLTRLITEIQSHEVRWCPHCRRQINFDGFITVHSMGRTFRGDRVVYTCIDEKQYRELERQWQDERVEFLCCVCFRESAHHPDIIDDTINGLHLRQYIKITEKNKQGRHH